MPLIQWHQQRFVQTQKANFRKIVYPSLEKIISDSAASFLKKQIPYKCRVVYSPAEIQTEFFPYQKRQINKLVLKVDDEIDYSFKYADRTRLNELAKDLLQDEEVLIVKNGFLTDTSFTNIALYDGLKWFTPVSPLLCGVQRNYLLSQNIVSEKEIALSDLKIYSRIKLFNALNFWEDAWELETDAIVFKSPAL